MSGSRQLYSSYLTRSRQKTINGRRAEIRGNTVQGQNIVDGSRYAPKAGFDSLQNVVELGSIVPLVYAKRETVGSNTSGGVRVNTNLLWSQVLSLNGDQLLRGIYLVGEGDSRPDSMELDPKQFALGNNLLGSYDLVKDNQSRVSIYYSNDGGRLTNADHPGGMPPKDDKGNFSTRRRTVQMRSVSLVRTTSKAPTSALPASHQPRPASGSTAGGQRFCLPRQPQLAAE